MVGARPQTSLYMTSKGWKDLTTGYGKGSLVIFPYKQVIQTDLVGSEVKGI